MLLEIYIFKAGAVGDRFRDALVAAARRGAAVRVMVDAFGSGALPAGYFAGGYSAAGATAVKVRVKDSVAAPFRSAPGA